MKFLVVGAGALGSIVAGHLARAGVPVTLVARGRRAAQLAEQGVRIGGLADFSVAVPVVGPDAEVDTDVLIQCVKTYDTASSLDGLRLTRPPIAFSLQNGVLKNEELARRYGAAQVLGATANISGELLDDGLVRFTMNDALPIGEVSGPRSARVNEIVGTLANAGVAAVASDEITSVEWTKYASFLPLMAVALLTRQNTWRNLCDPDCSRQVAMMVREMVALASASGVRVGSPRGFSPGAIAAGTLDEGAAGVRTFGEFFAKRAPGHRVSSLQDLLRGGRLEVDAILWHAVEIGRLHSVPVPTIETCAALCAVLNRLPREAAAPGA